MIVEIINEIGKLVCDYAPTHIHKKELFRNQRPPRYVWVPEGIGAEYAPGMIGGNPRVFQYDLHRFSVHCWGRNYEESLRMRQLLVTAVRNVMTGRNYEIGESECDEPDDAQHGYVISPSVTLRVPLPAAVVPVEGQIENDTITTATITQAAFDATGAVDGDGVLNAGEN